MGGVCICMCVYVCVCVSERDCEWVKDERAVFKEE